VDDDEVETRSMRFIVADIPPLVFGLLEALTGALHQSLVVAYNVAARNANFKHEQAIFREEAAIEIETLTGETDG
jgi:hypothetical protein